VKRAKGEESGKVGRGHSEAPSPSSPLPSNPEFDRFVDFARKIVNVPRAEIEEQERLYRERRKLPPKKKSKSVEPI
jgi:hypothetical protein